MSLQRLNASSFEEIVVDEGDPCLVIFSRKTCHVCQEVIPMLEQLQPKYEGKIDFYYVDMELERSLFQRYSLKGVPQLLFFNEGEHLRKLAGNVDEKQVEETIAAVFRA